MMLTLGRYVLETTPRLARNIESRVERLCLPVVKPGDMQVSSNVMVLPDTVPFDCYGADCLGSLV